jgi:hypothetical protein
MLNAGLKKLFADYAGNHFAKGTGTQSVPEVISVTIDLGIDWLLSNPFKEQRASSNFRTY